MGDPVLAKYLWGSPERCRVWSWAVALLACRGPCRRIHPCTVQTRYMQPSSKSQRRAGEVPRYLWDGRIRETGGQRLAARPLSPQRAVVPGGVWVVPAECHPDATTLTHHIRLGASSIFLFPTLFLFRSLLHIIPTQRLPRNTSRLIFFFLRPEPLQSVSPIAFFSCPGPWVPSSELWPAALIFSFFFFYLFFLEFPEPGGLWLPDPQLSSLPVPAP